MQEQANKLRAQFRDRYDCFRDKKRASDRQKSLKLALVILKANVKHRKDERKEAHLVAFC